MRNDSAKTKTRDERLVQSKRRGTWSKNLVPFGRKYSLLKVVFVDFWRLE